MVHQDFQIKRDKKSSRQHGFVAIGADVSY